jgi:hypothetical protein
VPAVREHREVGVVEQFHEPQGICQGNDLILRPCTISRRCGRERISTSGTIIVSTRRCRGRGTSRRRLPGSPARSRLGSARGPPRALPRAARRHGAKRRPRAGVDAQGHGTVVDERLYQLIRQTADSPTARSRSPSSRRALRPTCSRRDSQDGWKRRRSRRRPATSRWSRTRMPWSDSSRRQ